MPADAGWVKAKDLPKGPNGHGLCRYCAEETEPPRRTFCSDECVHEWKLRTNPGYVRKRLLERDRGICADCGLNVPQLYYSLRHLEHHVRERRRKELSFPAFGRSWWEGAHILAVSAGGGECGLANYKTLCVPCHKKDTVRLRPEQRVRAQEDSPDSH